MRKLVKAILKCKGLIYIYNPILTQNLNSFLTVIYEIMQKLINSQ
jgi:hypothetical protein